MDSERFDRLTLSLTEARSRRGVVASLVGVLSMFLAVVGAGPVSDAAAKRGKKKKACKDGKKRCGKRCVNLDSHNKHCGSCNNRCSGNETCVAGSCIQDPVPECETNNDCDGLEVCANGSCACTSECCFDSDCQGTEVCDTGTCTCPTECCANADCPSGGTCNLQSGQCVCPGNCCFDDDCAANQVCLNVNNQYNCFCDPQQVCGQACCPANLQCNQTTLTCV